MKNPRLLMLLVIIPLAAAGFYFISNPNSTPEQQNTDVPENAMMKKTDDTISTQTARYVDYSSDVLAINSYKKRVLFFYASWCPTCRPADANFKENEMKIPEDVVLIRVNYNDPETDAEEKELAQKYGITYQHTYVQIDAEGNQMAKWNGGQIEELMQNIK